eukprot:6204768-Pleurochrysis_carterae.AAC.6
MYYWWWARSDDTASSAVDQHPSPREHRGLHSTRTGSRRLSCPLCPRRNNTARSTAKRLCGTHARSLRRRWGCSHVPRASRAQKAPRRRTPAAATAMPRPAERDGSATQDLSPLRAEWEPRTKPQTGLSESKNCIQI